MLSHVIAHIFIVIYRLNILYIAQMKDEEKI